MSGTLFVCALALPAAALAQDITGPDDDSAAQQSQGPMMVERVHNGFTVAPDFRIGKVDGSTARLAGAYGGWVIDNNLLVGGGGYWLTNGSRTRDLAYGGAVIGWLARTDAPLGFGARTLIGFGEATLSDSIMILGEPFDRDRGRVLRAPMTVRAIFRERFFVAEPQADLLIRVTRQLRMDLGVAYRAIGGASREDSRLRGASGSVSLQIGVGSAERR